MKHRFTALLLLPALLVACPQAPTPEVKPPVLEQPFKPTLLGSLTVELGVDGKGAVAQFKPNTIKNQALTPVTESSLVFNNQVFQTIDIPTTTNRYLMARFTVTNNAAAARTNLTLVAYRRNGNAGGSAFTNIQTFAGGTVNENNLVPVNAMKTTGCTLPATVCVDNNNADLQIYTRSEITTLTTASSPPNGTLLNAGEGILQYAYVARSSATSRTIAASGGTGTVTLALQVPQAGDAGNGNNAYRYSMTFLVFTDNVARVTESTSEQGTDSGATARATSFGGSPQIATMCGTSLTSSTFIPGVRTVGVGVDTAWMGGNFFDNTGTTANFTGIIGNTEKAYTGANASLTARFSILSGSLFPVNRSIATATTTNGGNFGINNASTGTVTIRPKVNDRVADGFTYQVTDGFCTSPNFNATIAAPTNTVWYIDSAASAGGDGRSNTPFQNLSSLNVAAANTTANNDFIYVKGTGTNTATLTMKTGQQLIGSGVALVVGAENLQPAGTAPTIVNPIALNSVAGTNTISGLTVRSVTGSGFGTLTMSSASIAAGANQALTLTNGALAATLTSVSSSGGANGIQLTNTTGSLTVTGTGTTAESGGILTGHTADGINLATQFGTVSLKNMRISNSANEGVEAAPNTGTNSLKLEDVTINNAGSAAATTHNGVLYNASGTSSNTLELLGTVILTSGNQNTVAARIDTGDTSGVSVNTASGSTASMVLKVDKVSFRENATFGISTQFQANSATTTTIDNNRIFMTTADGSGIRYDADTPTQTHKLRISGNFIDLKETANTGASVGVDIRARQNATLQTIVDSNTINDNESNGILLFGGTGSIATTTNVQATISNNTISSPTTTSTLQLAGINVQSGVSGGSGVVTCLRIFNNTSNIAEVNAFNYNLRRVSATSNTFNLHGATGTPYTSASAVSSYLFSAPQSNLPNTPAKVQVLGSASPGYGTCTVVTPTFP